MFSKLEKLTYLEYESEISNFKNDNGSIMLIKFPKPEKKVTKEAIKITIRLNCNDFKAYLELVISRLHPSFSLHASKKSLSFKCTSFKGFSTFEISIFAL